MKKNLFQKVICFVLSVTTLLGAVTVTASAGKYKGENATSSTLEEMLDIVGMLSYDEYIADYGDFFKPGLSTIKVDVTDFTGDGEIVADSELCQNSRNEDQKAWENFGDNWENSVYLSSTGSVSWHFTVPKEQQGLYYLKIEYYNCETAESSISAVEKKLKIDGKVPFKEVSTVTFNKSWKYELADVVTSDAAGQADEVFETQYTTDKNGYYKIESYIKDGVKYVETYTITQDINGNSMAPGIGEYSKWNTYFCQDATGYYHDYFSFFIAEGTRTFTLEAEREPVIIKSIEFVPVDDVETKIPTYEEVVNKYQANGYGPATGGQIIDIQAEFPDIVSDSSVTSASDVTSAATFPSSSKADLYNVIGKTSYNTVGQWAAYNFRVSKTGLYKFSMRYLQSALQGMYICRTIKLAGGEYGLEDGTPTVPFLEAYNTQFNYSKEWQSTYLSDGSGDPFEFYFEAGTEYTLYLECSLGSLKEYIQRVETSLEKINECYLRIIQLTGTSADDYRDYGFIDIMPEVLVELLVQAKELEAVKDGLAELCGTNGSHIATLHTVAILLDKMGADEGDYIAANLSTLKTYLGTLGTWINNSKAGLMSVDSIYVIPADADDKALAPAAAGFFKSFWYEFSSFIYSFFTDFDQMGLTKIPDKNTPVVDVWLATGRDQSQIWRSMIDAEHGYTDSTGNAATLKLVTGGTLLPSVLACKGPDVYLGLGAADVINYAIRDAIIGMSGNDTKQLSAEENSVFSTTYYTYKEADGSHTTTTELRADGSVPSFVSNSFDKVVSDNFVDAAMDTLTLLDVSYGIPETMSFAMMFYRMDVLAELGQEVPETWDEILAILPALQTNNMSIGIAYINALDFMIYQTGGNMWKYTDESIYDSKYAGAKIDLDSDIALETFQFTCSLYTDYSFPVSYDASNRFRTGEMPILVGDYSSIYNTLVVFATEIEGLWEFCSLPGSIRDDGTYNYNSLAGVTATVVLHGCDNLLAAWQFAQWHTSADVQSSYGNSMVALIGPSAKYNTANVNAIEDLSWSSKEKAAIHDQLNNMSSIVNYPGSYIIARYLKFAFLDAVNDGADPVEALRNYIDAINDEITRKREEFELDTFGPGEEPEKKTSTNE